MEEDLYRKYRDLIARESGLFFSGENRPILESRLQERLPDLKRESLARYYSELEDDQEKLREFLGFITTKLTHFFRNASHYDVLINHAIPDLVRRKKVEKERSLLAWSAGCSTGEEPYTNAMVLQETLPDLFPFQVIASDIHYPSLHVAREGIYGEREVRHVPQGYLRKYFRREGGEYRVVSEIKKRVHFLYQNIKNDFAHHNLDLVFCRNVLIYFDDKTRKEVLQRVWTSMVPGAYLFVGHSESLLRTGSPFQFVETMWGCCYKKEEEP